MNQIIVAHFTFNDDLFSLSSKIINTQKLVIVELIGWTKVLMIKIIILNDH